ncbi:MAG: amino-acid N-acetyltransferase, partial [Methylococcaceae bacterium]
MPATDRCAYVEWFRGSAPYINAHRGKTFVIYFGGEAVADPTFKTLLHDVALLHSLGIRLVLVHGMRPQIDERLSRRRLTATYFNGLRVTDDAALECVKEAAGTVRVEIEALLSMGLPNSPMAGAELRVASGNFVIARPVGVRDGVDSRVVFRALCTPEIDAWLASNSVGATMPNLNTSIVASIPVHIPSNSGAVVGAMESLDKSATAIQTMLTAVVALRSS